MAHEGICVWVLASGPHEDLQKALQWAHKPDRVIAADGGTALARELGLREQLALTLNDLSTLYKDLGRFAQAQVAREEAQARRLAEHTAREAAEAAEREAMLAARRAGRKKKKRTGR